MRGWISVTSLGHLDVGFVPELRVGVVLVEIDGVGVFLLDETFGYGVADDVENFVRIFDVHDCLQRELGDAADSGSDDEETTLSHCERMGGFEE